jgi:hypothetical protein
MTEAVLKTSLVGTAFVIMWHDIAVEADDEYNLWHTREHMPERIALPGFLRSRRGVNRRLDRQAYFTLYEGESLECFLSDAYSRSLNHPTEWTQRVAPKFRNFLRMSCTVAISHGRGVGGALTTLRYALAPGVREQEAVESASRVIDRLGALRSVCGVHVGVSRPVFSGKATRETELRPPMHEKPFDIVVIVEGIGLAELERDEAAMLAALDGAPMRDPIVQSYDMAYMLARAH